MEMTAIETADATPIGARFTVDAKPLADALAFMTGRIIEKRNTTPALASVAMVAWPGRLDIMATDKDMVARISLPCDSAAFGAFLVDASALQVIAKKAGQGARLEFEQEDSRVAIDTGTSKARLSTIPPEYFPRFDPISADCHAFTLSAQFMADIARVAPFMLTDGTRPNLQGIALQRRQLAGRDRLLIAATDNRELSVWSRPVPAGAECLPDVVLPAKLAKLFKSVRKLVGDAPLMAEYEASNARMSLECGPVYLRFRAGCFTFPDVEDLVCRSIGDAPAQPLLIPELDPDINPATLERMAKAAGDALSWESAGDVMLATDPANPDWLGIACKGGMPKGYSIDYDQAHQAAAAYLADLASKRGLDVGKPEHQRLIVNGQDAGTVRGLTIGAQVYIPASVDYVQDWETLTMRRVETPARWEYAEGAYSVPMPRERQKMEAACSLTVDGETYPLATNGRGDIHLSKEAVRKIIGESCFETMAITLPDGRPAYILQWLWDEGCTRFCTVRADGRCATGKGDEGAAGVMVTRAEILAAMAGPIAAMESPAPIDEPAPEILAADPAQPESATHERPSPVSTPDGQILPPPVEIMPGDDLAARLDALEMAVRALQQSQAVPVATDDVPARPKRTPAHERAIRRAWAERKARRAARFMAELKSDQLDNANRSIAYWRDMAGQESARANRAQRARQANARRALSYRANMRAMRQTADQANAGLAQAIDERNAARAELAMLKRSLADPANPLRVDDATRLIDDARAAKARCAMLEQQNAQMRAMTERGADQLEAMIGRVTRAEAALRAAGLLSAPLALVAPDTVAA